MQTYAPQLEVLLQYAELNGMSGEFLIPGSQDFEQQTWYAEYCVQVAQELRSDMLQASPDACATEWRETPAFVRNGTGPQKWSSCTVVPNMLFAWTTSSRRVYHVDDQAKDLLEYEYFPARKVLSDIQMPFQSFAVTLESPLSSAEAAISTLIYAMIPHAKTGVVSPHILVVGDRINEAVEQGTKTLSRVSRALGRNEIERARKFAGQHVDAMTAVPLVKGWALCDVLCFQKSPDDTLVTVLQRIKDPLLQAAIEVVYSLAHMLQTLPRPLQVERGQNTSETSTAEAPDQIGLITDAAEICLVTERAIVRILSGDDAGPEDLVRGTHASPIPHWRSGYWRTSAQGIRKRIDAVIVNKHKLKPGQQVPGAERRFKKK